MHLGGHLEHLQTSVASVPAVEAVADASRAMSEGDGQLQTGSNSHQPAVVLHDEPPMTSVGAGCEETAVGHEGNWVAPGEMAVYLEERGDDGASRPGVSESHHSRGTYAASCDLHRHLSYV